MEERQKEDENSGIRKASNCPDDASLQPQLSLAEVGEENLLNQETNFDLDNESPLNVPEDRKVVDEKSAKKVLDTDNSTEEAATHQEEEPGAPKPNQSSVISQEQEVVKDGECLVEKDGECLVEKDENLKNEAPMKRTSSDENEVTSDLTTLESQNQREIIEQPDESCSDPTHSPEKLEEPSVQLDDDNDAEAYESSNLDEQTNLQIHEISQPVHTFENDLLIDVADNKSNEPGNKETENGETDGSLSSDSAKLGQGLCSLSEELVSDDETVAEGNVFTTLDESKVSEAEKTSEEGREVIGSNQQIIDEGSYVGETGELKSVEDVLLTDERNSSQERKNDIQTEALHSSKPARKSSKLQKSTTSKSQSQSKSLKKFASENQKHNFENNNTVTQTKEKLSEEKGQLSDKCSLTTDSSEDEEMAPSKNFKTHKPSVTEMIIVGGTEFEVTVPPWMNPKKIQEQHHHPPKPFVDWV